MSHEAPYTVSLINCTKKPQIPYASGQKKKKQRRDLQCFEARIRIDIRFFELKIQREVQYSNVDCFLYNTIIFFSYNAILLNQLVFINLKRHVVSM